MIPEAHIVGSFRRSACLGLICALLHAASALAGPAFPPRANDPPLLTDSGELLLRFEARSSRLEPGQAGRLDRLAALLGAQPDSRLVVFVPAAGDMGGRHFVASRLGVIDQELAKRGLAGRKVALPFGDAADDVVVLRVAGPPPTRTPEEGIGAAPDVTSSPPIGPAPGPTVVAASAVRDADALAAAAPVSLLPGGDSQAPPPATAPDNASAASAVAVEELWSAPAGRLLRQVLQDWGERAGWTVVWQSDHDYPVDAAATFSGDFTHAATELFEGFASAAPVPVAHFYKGNQVLLVQSGEGR